MQAKVRETWMQIKRLPSCSFRGWFCYERFRSAAEICMLNLIKAVS